MTDWTTCQPVLKLMIMLLFVQIRKIKNCTNVTFTPGLYSTLVIGHTSKTENNTRAKVSDQAMIRCLINCQTLISFSNIGLNYQCMIRIWSDQIRPIRTFRTGKIVKKI